LANNALAIRIIFPSVRVIQVSFNLTGLPASLGKQKSRSKERLFHIRQRLRFSNDDHFDRSDYVRVKL